MIKHGIKKKQQLITKKKNIGLQKHAWWLQKNKTNYKNQWKIMKNHESFSELQKQKLLV